MLEMEDLQLNLMNEQIVQQLEGINLQIKGVVLRNAEMGKSIYLRRNVMMRIPMIMMGAAHHVQLKMNTTVKMVQRVTETIERSVQMGSM